MYYLVSSGSSFCSVPYISQGMCSYIFSSQLLPGYLLTIVVIKTLQVFETLSCQLYIMPKVTF